MFILFSFALGGCESNGSSIIKRDLMVFEKIIVHLEYIHITLTTSKFWRYGGDLYVVFIKIPIIAPKLRSCGEG